MIFLLPIGHERKEVRRLPHVSIAILALNLLVFGATYLGEGSRQMDLVQHYVGRLFRTVARSPHTRLPPDFLDRIGMPEAERNRLEREQMLLREAAEKPPTEILEADQREVEDLCRRIEEALGETYFHRLGFVPARPRPTRLLSSMFIHAGWAHLIGNMLFFYLTGPFLEDVLGRPLFAWLYLVSGLAAVFTQWATDPTGTQAYGGASGAIAGLMGAFLVRFATTRIRFAYFFFAMWPLRILFLAVRNAHRLWRGTFWAPAYVMLPLWLVHQFYLMAKLGGEAGVAFWAHIGGFVFGAAVALLIQVARVEERWIHPAIEAELTFETHPALTKAIDCARLGRHKQARYYLNVAKEAAPGDPDLWLELFRNGVALGEESMARGAALRNVELETRAGRHAPAWETYLEAASRWPDLVWPPALLLALARGRDRMGDGVAAIDTYLRILFWHSREPVAARAHAEIATWAVRVGDGARAIQELEAALAMPGIEPAFRAELETRLADLSPPASNPAHAHAQAPAPDSTSLRPPVQPLPKRRGDPPS